MNKTDEAYMQSAIAFAQQKNKIWPFSTLVVDDASGDILVKTTDAAHISPIYHAESYAVHLLATRYMDYRDSGKTLTLYTTAECDPLSQASIFWAGILGFSINRVVYGAPMETISDLWNFGKQMSSRDFNRTFSQSKVVIEGPCMEGACTRLFLAALELHKTFNIKRPSSMLSSNLEDFMNLAALNV